MDLLDINYSDSYLKASNPINYAKSFQGIIKKLLIEPIKDLFFLFRCNTRNKIVSFYTSKNQLQSINPVHKEIVSSRLFGLNGKSENRIPMGIGCLLSILLTPLFIYRVHSLHKTDKKKILSRFEHYFFLEGVSLWWTVYLFFFKPKCIILASDHGTWHRVLRHVANKLKIPTVYIQHASVSHRFPKLEFSLSLLEGSHAEKVYKSIDNSGSTIKLIGMPKFDAYYEKINLLQSIKSIGICTNLLDTDDDIQHLVLNVKKIFPDITLFVRPHPQDKRKELYERINKEQTIVLSNAVKENSFDFLSKLDCIIAGESSIHLEAALLNVYSVYFNMGSSLYDYYEYIKNGVAQEAKDLDSLTNLLNKHKANRPNIRENAQYYVDTINTKYDGKSTQLAVKEIKQLLLS